MQSHTTPHLPDRASAGLLVAGAVGGILTMALHPTDGHHALETLDHGRLRVAVLVHALAIVSLFLQAVGGWGVLDRLGARSALARVGWAALVLAAAAGACAATISALSLPWFADVLEHAGPARREALLDSSSALHTLPLAFTQLYFAGSLTSVIAWTARLRRTGAGGAALGVLGASVSLGGVVAAVTGGLRPDVHSLLLFTAANGAWLIALGVWLGRGGARRG